MPMRGWAEPQVFSCGLWNRHPARLARRCSPVIREVLKHLKQASHKLLMLLACFRPTALLHFP